MSTKSHSNFNLIGKKMSGWVDVTFSLSRIRLWRGTQKRLKGFFLCKFPYGKSFGDIKLPYKFSYLEKGLRRRLYQIILFGILWHTIQEERSILLIILKLVESFSKSCSSARICPLSCRLQRVRPFFEPKCGILSRRAFVKWLQNCQIQCNKVLIGHSLRYASWSLRSQLTISLRLKTGSSAIDWLLCVAWEKLIKYQWHY